MEFAKPKVLVGYLLCTAVLVVTGTPFCFGAHAALTTGESEKNVLQEASKSEDVHFHLVLEGSGFKRGAIGFSFSDYKSEDGVLLERRVESYRSATRASEEMQRMIKKASKAIERGPKRDRDGRRIGERAVLMLRGSRSRQAQAVVLWTDGPKLYLLESPSLRHVLAFERLVYP